MKRSRPRPSRRRRAAIALVAILACAAPACSDDGDALGERPDAPSTTDEREPEVREEPAAATTTTTPRAERSFEISALDITAEITADGSMEVVERLRYDFDGEFNGGTRTIPTGDYRIVDFAVSEDGEPRDLAPGFDDPNRGGEVRWFGSADHSVVSGAHLYDVHYRVEGAIDVHPDVAVLTWFFVGSDFPALRTVSIAVTMPGDGTELRAFAHGDLHGIVEVASNLVEIEVTTNPAGSPLEVRVVAPASAFPGVTPAGPPVLDEILAEEERLAELADAALADATADYDAEVALGIESACLGDVEGVVEAACQELASILDEAARRIPGSRLTLDDLKRYAQILEARRTITHAGD